MIMDGVGRVNRKEGSSGVRTPRLSRLRRSALPQPVQKSRQLHLDRPKLPVQLQDEVCLVLVVFFAAYRRDSG
jgi:hypothetical protein